MNSRVLHGSRYRRLLQSVYLDIVKGASHLRRGRSSTAVANLLELVPYNEAFYNVSFPFPRYLPDGRAVPSGAEGQVVDLALGRLLARPLLQFDREIHFVFDTLFETIEGSAWLPAVVSPDMRELVAAWLAWYEERVEVDSTSSSSRKPLLRESEVRRWFDFSRLLLAITPQAAVGDRSAAATIYEQVTKMRGGSEPLDEDYFLAPSSHPYNWGFVGGETFLGRLRDVLELAHLVPLPAAVRADILREVLSDTENARQVGLIIEKRGRKAQISALGGPLYHLGQMEGVIYIAVPYATGPLDAEINGGLKELAADGAARRHRAREQAVQDALLQEARRAPASEFSAPLLVLRHLPSLYSLTGAACINVTRSAATWEAGAVLRVGQPAMEKSPNRRMWCNLNLKQIDHALVVALRRAVPRNLGGEPAGYSRNDSVFKRFMSVFDRLPQGSYVSKESQTILVLPVQALLDVQGAEEWTFVLMFREPWTRRSFSSQNLGSGIGQLQLEIQALVDLVTTLARTSSYRVVLGQTGHALVSPIKRLVTLADVIIERATRRNDACGEALPELMMLRNGLAVTGRRALAAKLFFGRIDGASANDGASDLTSSAEKAVTLVAPRVGVRLVTHQPKEEALVVSADPGLLDVVLGALIDNALDAAEEWAARTRESATVAISALRQVKTIEFRTVNEALNVSQAGLEKILANAAAGLPNRPRHSGGTGLGLLMCQQILRALGGRLTLSVDSKPDGTKLVTTIASLPPRGEVTDE